jgi:hypothetical protein
MSNTNTGENQNISEGQKVLMQSENYNILKIIDNTILGFFIGIISGMGIEAFMNLEFSWQQLVFIVTCIVSIYFIIRAMSYNDKYVQACKDTALGQNTYCNRGQIIEKLTDSKHLSNKFKRCFYIALIFFAAGIIVIKIIVTTTPPITCPCQTTIPQITILTDSIK